MIKKVTVEVEFPDDFVPPIKSDSDVNCDDACRPCPFYSCLDSEYGVYECVLIASEKCPIRKYFESDMISKKTRKSM